MSQHQLPVHAGNTAAGKALWVFLIMIKAITKQGANWFIAWAFV